MMDTTKLTSTLAANDLKALENQLCIRDPSGRPVLMIGLSATFLFVEPWLKPAREAATDVAGGYLQRFGPQLKWAQDPQTARIYPLAEKRVPLPHDWIPNNPDGHKWDFGFHGGESELASSAYYIDGFGTEKYGSPDDDLGYVHMHLPLEFMVSHPGEFQKIVLGIAKRLKPLSGYAGLGFLEPLDIGARKHSQELLTPLAFRFPGIEANDHAGHTIWCHRGIKGVNWLTILSDGFVDEAGGYEYLRVRLDEPSFPFYKYDGGLMIQAGPHPEVGDATQNRWPRHYVTLAKVLKNIQIKEHCPFHFGGEGRMDKAMSEAWLFRFDGK